MDGEIYDLDVLQSRLKALESNLKAVEAGLERELQKRDEYEKLIAGENDYDPEALRRGLTTINANIDTIEEAIKREREKRDSCIGDIAVAKTILKAHNRARGRDGVSE